ncbi:MAG: hypothetical protein DME50_00965 [Verrucomicrobia bacterium]|nr:MAG: hypothetical protein DME50_00965 [Verrucomicrobiota bacterium]
MFRIIQSCWCFAAIVLTVGYANADQKPMAQAVAKMQQSSYAMIENVLWSVDRKARQERR